MTYLIETPCKYNSKRTDVKIDLARFAADLAKALDKATLLPEGEYPSERQKIEIASGVLDVTANTYKKRVDISIGAPDVAYGDWSIYDKAQQTESASINPNGRRIELIARDITKRVIVANQPALAARRVHAKQQQQKRDDIVKHADALKKAQPSLDIRVNKNAQRAEVYDGRGHYISATLHADDTVAIERIGSVSRETFCKIVALLNEGKAK